MSELKICPFCGKTLIADRAKFFVHPVVGCLLDGIPIKNDTESIKRWNTRKPMQNIVERLEHFNEETFYCANGRANGKTLAYGYSQGIHKAIETVKEEGDLNE